MSDIPVAFDQSASPADREAAIEDQIINGTWWETRGIVASSGALDNLPADGD